MGDVWCEDTTNKRFVINACTPAASYKTTPLVYSLTMSLVEYSDVLYTGEANDLVENKDKWQTDPEYKQPVGTDDRNWERLVD